MAETDQTLTERGKRYGNYRRQTAISNELRQTMRWGMGDKIVETDIEDAITMICVKLSRIANGDPNYADNWADIAGYATLVKDRLEGNERE